MARPCKLTPELQNKIGENVSLGLTYSLASEAAGITYKTFNEWNKKGQTEKSGKYYQFAQHIKKCNADGARKLLERLNDAAEAGNCQVCMFILERRFPEEFGRRIYRKTNVVSENINANVELTVQEADILRKQILAKFDRF
jgi:hypothetical protein